MKSTRLALSLLLTATSLTMSLLCSAQHEKSRTRPVIPYEHAKLSAPPGMVYVPGGSTIIKYSQQATDSNCVKKVSLSSFFIDKTEVTNQQYRQFVNWVIDSIAITKYLQDDKYFRDKKVTDSTLKAVYVRRINWSRVDHKAIFSDPETRAKLAAMLDERGQIKRDSVLFSFTYLRAGGSDTKVKVGTRASLVVGVYPDEEIWAKDLPNAQTDIMVENYFSSSPYDDYPVVGVSWLQARAYSYWRSITSNGYNDVADYMQDYHLSFSLPSEAQWVYAAQQDMKGMMANVKSSEGKPEKEEKGKKATASDEKDKKSKKKKTKPAAAKVDSSATVSNTGNDLPVDANSSWTSSTSTTVDNSASLKADSVNFYDPSLEDKTAVPTDKRGLIANFKQDEGDYTGDGSPFTVPVMSYAPNGFGIYNMVGNVSEWTMDAYSPSAFAFVSDINPVLLFDADSTEAEPMRRKVVRGGSFISNAKSLSPYAREFELQTTVHSFIGFRCVMAAPEILTEVTATRKKSQTATAKKK